LVHVLRFSTTTDTLLDRMHALNKVWEEVNNCT